MTISNTLKPIDKHNVEAMLQYDKEIRSYYMGMKYRNPLEHMPDKPKGYGFYHTNYELSKQYLGVEQLDLTNSIHTGTLSQILTCTREQNYTQCEPKVAAFIFNQQVNQLVDTQRFRNRAIAATLHGLDATAGAIAMVAIRKPTPQMIVPATLAAGWQTLRAVASDDAVEFPIQPASPESYSQFVAAISQATPQQSPTGGQLSETATALYRYQGLVDVLQNPNLSPQGRILIDTAMHEQLQIILRDKPTIINDIKQKSGQQDDTDITKFMAWTSEVFEQLQSEQGDLYQALFDLQANQSHAHPYNLTVNVQAPESTSSATQITAMLTEQGQAIDQLVASQQQAQSEQRTQTLRQIKQQTFHDGIQFAATIANLTGNPKLGQAVQVIGGATLSIHNAIQSVQTLQALGSSALLSFVNPALAIANSIMSVVSLFKSKSDGMAKALNNIYRGLSQQIQQLSGQINQLRQEMHKQFQTNFQILSVIYDSLQEGFAQAADDLSKLTQLAHDIYSKLETLEAQNYLQNENKLTQGLRKVDAMLSTDLHPVFSPGDESATKHLRTCYQIANFDARLGSLMLGNSLDNHYLRSAHPLEHLSLLVEHAKKQGVILTDQENLVKPSLFYGAMLRYYYILTRFQAAPEYFDIEQPLNEFIKHQAAVGQCITAMGSTQTLPIYQQLLNECQTILQNIIDIVQSKQANIEQPALTQAVNSMFSAFENSVTQEFQRHTIARFIPRQGTVCDNNLAGSDLSTELTTLNAYKATCLSTLHSYSQLSAATCQLPTQLAYTKAYNYLPNEGAWKTLQKHPRRYKQTTLHIAYQFPFSEPLRTKITEAHQQAIASTRDILSTELSHYGSELCRLLNSLLIKTTLLHHYIYLGHYTNHEDIENFPLLQLLDADKCPWAPTHMHTLFKNATSVDTICELLQSMKEQLIPAIAQQIENSTHANSKHCDSGLPWLAETQDAVNKITDLTHYLSSTTNVHQLTCSSASSTASYSYGLQQGTFHTTSARDEGTNPTQTYDHIR